MSKLTQPISQDLNITATDTQPNTKISARGVDVFYGAKQALFGIDLDVASRMVTSLIGPSGCGKSTFIRCLNRMNDVIDGCRVEGKILLDENDIYRRSVDVVQLRALIGMVFQKPNPFPKSIYDNVAYGPRIHGLAATKDELDEIVESSLQRAGLWNEAKDRLSEPGTSLSGGQQQRLCIARAIAVSPEVILMDEPSAGLAPKAAEEVLEMARALTEMGTTILLVEQNVNQALRLADQCYILAEGRNQIDGKATDLLGNSVVADIYLGGKRMRKWE